MNAISSARRVVILGGGFGGVYAARQLERLARGHANFEVTLISRDNYLLMTPLLFEAGSGILEPRHAVEPIRPLLRGTRFVEAEVHGVDVGRKLVRISPSPGEEFEIPFDHVVLALGGVTNRALIRGSEHAITFKTLADAIFLRNYVIELFERADAEPNALRKSAMLTFVVIGGGLVGVELLGELTMFTRNLCRTYPRIEPSELRFELLEAGPRIMPEIDEDLAVYAADVLRRRGVTIRTGCPARSIEPGRVHVCTGPSIDTSTVILAAGVAPNPILHQINVAKDGKGRIAVDATMRSTSHDFVWAIGDCARIPDPAGKPYPPLAQHALREAKVLAGNILAAMRRQPLKPFVYEKLGILAALGHYKGVGRIMWLKLKGFPAWWVWRTYYLMQMPRWERRLRIMLDWTVALLFKNDIVKLDLFGEQHPLRRYERRWIQSAEMPPKGESIRPQEESGALAKSETRSSKLDSSAKPEVR